MPFWVAPSLTAPPPWGSECAVFSPPFPWSKIKDLISRPAPPRPPLSFSFDGMRRAWLVLGAARKSATWESESLSDENAKSSDLYPLRQLASYAAASGKPYTFIVTDQELVVVRFFLVEDNPSHLGVEWKAIRWAETGDNVLTANLAIWCLVMMALNEDHQKIQLRSRTPPISLWKSQEGPEGAAFYKHCLSLRAASLDTHGASTW